ncbi:adenosine 5'-monophosphoramidase HINT3-like isoform X5 [Tachypleus tridentatus]|uniref:adenosine 5'-monophosphoramidase HINT3-like isoform X5 n=1 Tax=Tachypleus tridentatus TaxID=6853 RepID=UPI003FD1B248
MSAYNINSECTFCTIATGKDPSTVILYQDEDYVAFEDISPAALHHYLIIPKIHIQDARSLTPEHIPMVEHMSELGMNLLKERGGKDTDTRRLGNMNQQYTRPSIWQNGRNADGKPSFTYLIYQQVGLAPELGYHWPPFTSVKHLHLHIIFPVSEMSVLSKLIFWPRNLWFVMPEYDSSICNIIYFFNQSTYSLFSN